MNSSDSLWSLTTPESAPDVTLRQRIGGVDCHFATKENRHDKHPEQQDRIAITALPHATGSEFRHIMGETYRDMKKKYDELRSNPEFGGGVCTTMVMLDPLTGDLAIGSKGDAAVYMVLQNKFDSEDRLIQRISSPRMKIKKGDVLALDGMGRGKSFQWAQPGDWQVRDTEIEPGSEDPAFELLNIKTLRKDIVKECCSSKSLLGKYLNKPELKPEAENYSMSLIIASDGITSGKQGAYRRMDSIAKLVTEGEQVERIFPSETNKARRLLDYVSNKNMSGYSKDN